MENLYESPERAKIVNIDIPFTPDITVMDEFIVKEMQVITGDEKGRGNKNSIVRVTLQRL